jgi:hypothetical protein
MKTSRFVCYFYALWLVMCLTGSAQAQTHIQITSPMAPPGWALLECELLRANTSACEAFADRYLDDRGFLLHTATWGTLAGTDDAIETFMNWTLLHSLGASDSVLELFKKAQEGHFIQYKEVTTQTTDIAKDGCYYKEFMPMSDWLHNGEAMRGFHFQGLSDPTDDLFQTRVRRYAGFYMNEDPEADNYDPEHKIIRSIWNGSKGPMLRDATGYDWVGDPLSGKFNLLHVDGGRDEMMDFEEMYPEMLRHYEGPRFIREFYHSAGDHPLNLIATNLFVNAYALMGEEKYRDWIVEYVGAWKERIERNNGNIPTNIGLDGTIGGEFDGKWYMGPYGWNGYNTFDRGPWRGFSNALLVTGDQAYIDVLRHQIDNIYAQQKVTGGKVTLPHNYGDEGWYNWTTNLYTHRLIDIYLWSMDRKDLERIPSTGWIAFLEGENPGYPEQAFRRDLSRIREKTEFIQNDPTTPDTRLADWLMNTGQAATNGLMNLMMGAYVSGKQWTLHARVRYFDPARNRAGIPEDVAALVTEMTEDMTKITLVNISQVSSREVIVQTGAYGEHQCIKVVADEMELPVNHRFFTVRLAPGTGSELTIYHDRYKNKPTLAFPWHGDTVPLQ